MGIPQSKSCPNGFLEPFPVQRSDQDQESHINNILNPAVGSLKTWEGVGMQFLRKLLFFGDGHNFCRMNPSKTQPVSSFQHFCWLDSDITHPDIEMKLCKDTSSQ